VYGTDASSDGMGGMPMEWHKPAEQWQGAPTPEILDVRALEGPAVDGLLRDVPTNAVPPGTTTFRVEVAGADQRGSLQVVASNGDFPIEERPLPFAVEVDTDDPEAFQWVVAHSADRDREIQCRIYAGEDLVAIETGHGVAECVLPPP
jgi:hypothetical protein